VHLPCRICSLYHSSVIARFAWVIPVIIMSHPLTQGIHPNESCGTSVTASLFCLTAILRHYSRVLSCHMFCHSASTAVWVTMHAAYCVIVTWHCSRKIVFLRLPFKFSANRKLSLQFVQQNDLSAALAGTITSILIFAEDWNAAVHQDAKLELQERQQVFQFSAAMSALTILRWANQKC